MSEKELIEMQLERVRKSIETIEVKGQESLAESGKAKRQTTRADLQTLYERERQLIIQLNRLGGSNFSRMVT